MHALMAVKSSNMRRRSAMTADAIRVSTTYIYIYIISEMG